MSVPELTPRENLAFIPNRLSCALLPVRRTVIRAQTLGAGLQPHRLENLNRYETHLDRKFERTLAMILKLKELRGG